MSQASEEAALARKVVEPQAFSIQEFCIRNDISITTYYKLKKQGLGPREMYLGGVIRITAKAEADWQKDRETPDEAEARLIKLQRDARTRASRMAAMAAVASPDHTSKHPELRKKRRDNRKLQRGGQ